MTVWNFSCPDDGGSYDLEIGPTQGLEPALRRALTFGLMGNTGEAATVMVDPADPLLANLKGTLLSEAQYDALGVWWQRTLRVRITDRLARVFSVLIVDLDRQRAHSASHPWKHTWTMTVDVLQITFPPLTLGGDTTVAPLPYLTWAAAEGTWADHTETWTEATV